jgi:hypothetical protein
MDSNAYSIGDIPFSLLIITAEFKSFEVIISLRRVSRVKSFQNESQKKRMPDTVASMLVQVWVC